MIQAEYRGTDRIAAGVAQHIRDLGWDAEAAIHGFLQIPAVEAGLGQLGKHGSMISANSARCIASAPYESAAGSRSSRRHRRRRLLCDLSGLHHELPAHAIFDSKQLVRGRERWYVDFACIPYFVENHGCGICIGVCPWSDPGRRSVLTQDAGPPQQAGGHRLG